MLNFRGNLLSALLYLKIFACNYQSDNGQTNEGTDRLTNIVTYRAAIAAKKPNHNIYLIVTLFSIDYPVF